MFLNGFIEDVSSIVVPSPLIKHCVTPPVRPESGNSEDEHGTAFIRRRKIQKPDLASLFQSAQTAWTAQVQDDLRQTRVKANSLDATGKIPFLP
jgi:hypothetical protein